MKIRKPPGAFKRCRYQKVDIPMFNILVDIIPKEETIIDIGAGSGVTTKAFIEKGFYIRGIDGTPNIDKHTDGLIGWVNLVGNCEKYYNCADWGLFIEVGEHVPKEYESILIDNVCKIPRKYMVVTWARIGQRGYQHVNCQSQSYVISEFTKRGWLIEEEMTMKIKKSSGAKRTVIKNAIVFCKG